MQESRTRRRSSRWCRDVRLQGGLALWLGAARGRERLRKWFVPRRDPKGRKRTLSWHGAVGLWVSAGFLALSVIFSAAAVWFVVAALALPTGLEPHGKEGRLDTVASA